jgi:hypothetical protein
VWQLDRAFHLVDIQLASKDDCSAYHHRWPTAVVTLRNGIEDCAHGHHHLIGQISTPALQVGRKGPVIPADTQFVLLTCEIAIAFSSCRDGKPS